MENKRSFVLGIDPGREGFMVVLDLDSRLVIDSYKVDFFQDGQFDAVQCYLWLTDLLKEHNASIVRCRLESVHAIFGASAKATFQFGRCLGSLETFLVLTNPPFRSIRAMVSNTVSSL